MNFSLFVDDTDKRIGSISQQQHFIQKLSDGIHGSLVPGRTGRFFHFPNIIKGAHEEHSSKITAAVFVFGGGPGWNHQQLLAGTVPDGIVHRNIHDVAV